MIVHGGDVSGPLVPLAVIVVGHDSDPVEVLGEYGYIVAGVDDLLARRDGRGKEETTRLELGAQLAQKIREAFLVRARTLTAVGLWTRQVSKF